MYCDNDNYFIDFNITPTGQGNPHITYYDQNEQDFNNYNSSYCPSNKY